MVPDEAVAVAVLLQGTRTHLQGSLCFWNCSSSTPPWCVVILLLYYNDRILVVSCTPPACWDILSLKAVTYNMGMEIRITLSLLLPSIQLSLNQTNSLSLCCSAILEESWSSFCACHNGADNETFRPRTWYCLFFCSCLLRKRIKDSWSSCDFSTLFLNLCCWLGGSIRSGWRFLFDSRK